MHCAEPWGRENVNILAQTSSEVSLFKDACVAHLFTATMFPRLETGVAKHFVCFPLILPPGKHNEKQGFRNNAS